jgi:hypothetical protein
VSVTVGLVSFVVTELVDRVWVPDLGRPRERLLAESVSAVVVAGLTAGFMEVANQRQEAALLRMSDNQLDPEPACLRVISESVDRIKWTLRKVLFAKKADSEEEIDWLRYSATKIPRRTIYAIQEKTNE